MSGVFRPKREAPADRTAGDRVRHREKVRSSIRENIADIIAEESIIGRSGDRIVKVPIRGIKEYRFVYGDNDGQVGEPPVGADRLRGLIPVHSWHLDIHQHSVEAPAAHSLQRSLSVGGGADDDS